ncbi:unnamed protein product [Ilex paraguariensis]|uniref:Cytochrome P450 n=1 Tax=Ilex paraguariensis TaxID=185542 RepID=A0ABC8TQH9_9AQUA
MELIIAFTVPLLAGIFTFLLFVYYVIGLSKSGHGESRKSRSPPEAAGAWPLIGHLHLLKGPELPHKTLENLPDKYGPVFSIRLGVHRALIVNTWEIAKECFTINDRVISVRPRAIALEHLTYNYAMFGFSPYGEYWRELRKIATLQLLSNHRLAMLNSVIESEVKVSIKGVYDLCVKNKNDSKKTVLEMKKWFGGLTLNLILRVMVGK